MRFINALSYKSADYLMRQMNGNHESRRVYYYGFQIVIGALFKGLLLLLLAFITGTMLPALTIVAAFVILRSIAGGYHMKTYGKCIAASLGMIILAALISKYTAHMLNQISLIAIVVLSFVFSSASLIKWAPADNPNRPITDKKEIKKFRILSMIYIVIWLVLSLTLVYFKQNMFVLALCLGVILEVFSITPAGIRFFKMIEKGMDSVKNDINRHSSK
ncbi:MAG TPA: accessory regulator AgrB [Hungateiclostridium thermocellum]|jgi:accessory gene regulator B|uniref:Accessory gene regulator B n=2 Tax=Acetivibrio thermocellus TaxID=1515 RepID=A3DHY1_ACET2|nr:accessory gene regulator B family protein [Acetivibrio thermocellus]CDG36881.1 accessory gene regulator B [Acetivibrio thermocellus BC1]ABN53560.1 Accessory gene regulator B [Acetivibrio thermocellus ATCC 27405]ADU75999.1 Accessory gene regulator B [Acetivibrio thermocellus DSM 1313]ALX10034.1 Accessory protein regulator B [Acetivibrio thermocellus AD2]ANV77808.1 Accessory regulator protein B [Acetivibrio thermocellus DSM 2360]